MKPVHAKPSLYAYIFLQLKEIALTYGYNLVIHGSMTRDLDLIAIPWESEIKPCEEMIDAFAKALGGELMIQDGMQFSMKPHGRIAYIIDLNRGGYYDGIDPNGDKIYVPDPQYYIDISVMTSIVL